MGRLTRDCQRLSVSHHHHQCCTNIGRSFKGRLIFSIVLPFEVTNFHNSIVSLNTVYRSYSLFSLTWCVLVPYVHSCQKSVERCLRNIRKCYEIAFRKKPQPSLELADSFGVFKRRLDVIMAVYFAIGDVFSNRVVDVITVLIPFLNSPP